MVTIGPAGGSLWDHGHNRASWGTLCDHGHNRASWGTLCDHGHNRAKRMCFSTFLFPQKLERGGQLESLKEAVKRAPYNVSGKCPIPSLGFLIKGIV